MRIKHAKTVSLLPILKATPNCCVGGEIGHRKYDCPQQRNFTANIICRVCGNAGHMARDCPDRQRGADWHNGPPQGGAPGKSAGRIGAGDAGDREYEQLMQELTGGAPSDGPRQAIEAGAGGFENGGQGYGSGDRDAKPWQRGPTGAPAPWQRVGNQQQDDYNQGGSAPPWARGGSENYGGYNQGGGYDGPPGGGAAPWQRQDNAPPPPPSGDQYGYGGYPGGYGGGYGGQQNMGPPPGIGQNNEGLGAPPGLGALFQNYGANGTGAPPPPPTDDAPPVSVLHNLLYGAANSS